MHFLEYREPAIIDQIRRILAIPARPRRPTLEAMIAPRLRSGRAGRFKATDALIALLNRPLHNPRGCDIEVIGPAASTSHEVRMTALSTFNRDTAEWLALLDVLLALRAVDRFRNST